MELTTRCFLDQKFSKQNSFGNGIGQCVSPRVLHRSFSGKRGKDWGSGSTGCHVYGECAFEQREVELVVPCKRRKWQGIKWAAMCQNQAKMGLVALINEWNKEYADVSEVVNSPSGSYTEFPFNFLAFFAVLLMNSWVFSSILWLVF